MFWRRHPDLNRGSGCCRPTPYLLAIAPHWSGLRGSNPLPPPWQGGALPDELNPRIKFKLWCLRSESNQRHGDFQSPALPTELQRQVLRLRLKTNLLRKLTNTSSKNEISAFCSSEQNLLRKAPKVFRSVRFIHF